MTVYAFEEMVPKLGTNVYVADNAAVIGDVEIGDDSSVWFSCVLRGDMYPIRVGKRTNIQDGTVLHVTQDFAACHVGDDVVVGHMVLLHGCRIGNRCLIGMGSTLLDNVVVGDNCVIAAGSLLKPGMVVPPYSLVMGRPAVVVKQLTDADMPRYVDGGVQIYQHYAARFKAGLRKIDG